MFVFLIDVCTTYPYTVCFRPCGRNNCAVPVAFRCQYANYNNKIILSSHRKQKNPNFGKSKQLKFQGHHVYLFKAQISHFLLGLHLLINTRSAAVHRWRVCQTHRFRSLASLSFLCRSQPVDYWGWNEYWYIYIKPENVTACWGELDCLINKYVIIVYQMFHLWFSFKHNLVELFDSKQKIPYVLIAL